MGLDVAKATAHGDFPGYQLMQDHTKAVDVRLQPV